MCWMALGKNSPPEKERKATRQNSPVRVNKQKLGIRTSVTRSGLVKHVKEEVRPQPVEHPEGGERKSGRNGLQRRIDECNDDDQS